MSDQLPLLSLVLPLPGDACPPPSLYTSGCREFVGGGDDEFIALTVAVPLPIVFPPIVFPLRHDHGPVDMEPSKRLRHLGWPAGRMTTATGEARTLSS